MKITNFFPPIEERETEELIGIAHSTTDYWQQEAIDQALAELEKRNISKEYQLELVAKWNESIKDFERQLEKQFKENESKKYSILQQIIIFLISPLILLGKVNYDMSMTDLKNEHFLEKVKQRRMALIAGALFYLSAFYFLLKT
jgi:hypothetical protein